MTELHSSSSTSNSPIQTQLPHICTPAASLGNPRQVGWLAKKTRKKSFIFGCWNSRTPQALNLSSAGTETANWAGHVAVCSFSELQNVTNPNGAAEMRVCLGGEQEES